MTEKSEKTVGKGKVFCLNVTSVTKAWHVSAAGKHPVRLFNHTAHSATLVNFALVNLARVNFALVNFALVNFALVNLVTLQQCSIITVGTLFCFCRGQGLPVREAPNCCCAALHA